MNLLGFPVITQEMIEAHKDFTLKFGDFSSYIVVKVNGEEHLLSDFPDHIKDLVKEAVLKAIDKIVLKEVTGTDQSLIPKGILSQD